MQTYQDQAKKNGVELINEGPCQFCGAKVSRGIEECMDLFNEICGREFSDAEYGKVHLMTVDCHALQHSEVHGKRNNHYHLLRLCMMLGKGGDMDLATKYRMLNPIVDALDEPPPLPPPPVLERGEVTVKEIYAAKTPEEHCKKVLAWGEAVWNAWKTHHTWAEEMIEKLYNS